MTAPLAVYIHWPFCLSKCGYCDFNSYAAGTADQAPWRDGLIRELEHFAAETQGRPVETVFFGGGTPSLMEPRTVAAVLEAVVRLWTVAEDAEITLEANPTSSEAARFKAFRTAGVNRLSLGVQSLDDAALRFLGRAHDAAEARRAVDLAVRTFDRHSIDLIYGLPDQDPDLWRKQLTEALVLARDHISLYQLTVEAGTPFARAGVAEADEDRGVALYEGTQEVLGVAGLPAYEISNHARPGAECRHNLEIWRGRDYLGIGPGAHGRLTRDGVTEALHQVRDPKRWLARIRDKGHGTAGRNRLTLNERREELILLGLRLTEGIPAALADTLPQGRVIELIETAHLARGPEGGLVATSAGRLCLNALLARLLA
jgi:oxygen-independent coproporphyrinogen-3 oxidase